MALRSEVGSCLAAAICVKKKVRVRNLTIRISSEDYDMLVARAEEAGMTQSEYVRFLIRRARIRVSVEV